jgi:hypothetical protein
MPSKKSSLHVDTLLSNVSVKYKNEEYIAERIFPSVPVKKMSDKYWRYGRDFRIPETRRASRAEANEHTFEVSTASYSLERHAVKDYVSVQDYENYDMFDLRSDTTEELTDVILRRLEKSVLDVFTTTNWSLNQSLAAGNAWGATNTAASDPIKYANTAAAQILRNSGVLPNYGVMKFESLNEFKDHVSILDRIKYTSAEVTEKMAASLLGIQELLISKASYDSAAEGATASIGAILGDHFFLGYKPARPSPKALSSGYIFKKSAQLVKRWFDNDRDSDVIEVEMYFSPRVVATLTGFLIADVR